MTRQENWENTAKTEIVRDKGGDKIEQGKTRKKQENKDKSVDNTASNDEEKEK